MEEKYAETIAKHGLLFMNLKYLERLNFDDTSLVREKWTTELFEKDVEVMPIIFENEEYKQEDGGEDPIFDEIQSSFSASTSRSIIDSVSSGQEFEIQTINTNKNTKLRTSSCGESWWVTMENDMKIEQFQSEIEFAVDLGTIWDGPVSASTNFKANERANESITIAGVDNEMNKLSKVKKPTVVDDEMKVLCRKSEPIVYPSVDDKMEVLFEKNETSLYSLVDDEMEVLFKKNESILYPSVDDEMKVLFEKNQLSDYPVVDGEIQGLFKSKKPIQYPFEDDKMEVLFKKVAEPRSDDEIDTMCIVEHVHSLAKPVQSSSCQIQKAEACTNLLNLHETFLECSITEKCNSEVTELVLPHSVSSENCIPELKSGRISRPLSGRYSMDQGDDNSIESVRRTESIMDLTKHEEGDNLSLSSMYEKLSAGLKPNSSSKRPKSASPVLELFRSTHSEEIIKRSGRNSFLESKSALHDLKERSMTTEPNSDSTPVLRKNSNVTAKASIHGRKSRPMFLPNFPQYEFSKTIQQETQKYPKKRTHQHYSSRSGADNSSTKSETK